MSRYKRLVGVAHGLMTNGENAQLAFLATAMQKVLFLEHKIEENGDPRGYMRREIDSLCWLIETARDSDPDVAALIPQAEGIADDRFARSLANRPPKD